VNVAVFDLNLLRVINARAEIRDNPDDNRPVDSVLFDFPRFDDLSYEELDGLVATLKHLRHAGGIQAEEGKAEYLAEVDKMKGTLDEAKVRKEKKDRGGASVPQEWWHNVKAVWKSLFHLRNQIRVLDNWNDDGYFYDSVYRRMEEGQNHELRLNREMHERFEKSLGNIHKIGIGKRDERDYMDNDGEIITLTAEKRFMFAVYWGTQSSREALLDGYNLSEETAYKIMSELTDEQLDAVNAVWKLNESLWGDLSSASVTMYGVTPPKIDATPFEINGKQMSGGHMRLFYDDAKLEMEAEKTEMVNRNNIGLTKAGSLHSRKGGGGKDVLLSMNSIPIAIAENVKFIAYAKPSAEVSRIINNEEIKNGIVAKHGEVFYRGLVQTLNGITGNVHQTEELKWFGKFFGYLRNVATLKYLAFSLRNVVQGFPTVVSAIGEAGFINYFRNTTFMTKEGRKKLYDEIDELSEFMNDRGATINRETHEVMSRMLTKNKVSHFAQEAGKRGFFLQTFFDGVIARPLWRSVYDSKMSELIGQGMSEAEAQKIAVSRADSAVGDAVGSGTDLHLGRMLHSNQKWWIKTLTMFGSWFNNFLNLMYKKTHGFDLKYTVSSPSAMYNVLALPMFLALASAMIAGDMPDWDEEEDTMHWFLKTYFGFMLGGVPVARGATPIIFDGYAPKAPEGVPFESLQKVASGVVDIATGEADTLQAVKTIVDGTTSVVPIAGSSNLTRVLDFAVSDEKGNEEAEGLEAIYQALVEGRDKNK
jgi:hypothetical protein